MLKKYCTNMLSSIIEIYRCDIESLAMTTENLVNKQVWGGIAYMILSQLLASNVTEWSQ